MTFENIGLSKELKNTIQKLGFTEPTQVQRESIPLIIEGKNVVAESATGSGKTLAFGCGLLERVDNNGLQAIILTPTRELAEQVKTVLDDLSKGKKYNVLAIYGGVSINPQIDKLPRANIVVATPGRLLDHLQRRTIDTSKVKILVLDEADRMFDMGFIDDVENIIEQCPNVEQKLFFSATISPRIKSLAERHMINFEMVQATKQVDPTKLYQEYYNLPQNRKIGLLVHLIKNENTDLCMIFCNTRSATDFVVKNLKLNGIKAIGIHGGFTQNKRSRTMELFGGAKVNVLVCTDVAARGLDIESVSHVYNYEIPADPVDYVHRIGRTARAGESGKVINLLSERDYPAFSRILEEYRDFKIIKKEVPTVEKVKIESNRFGDRGGSGRSGRLGGRPGGRPGNRSGGRPGGRPGNRGPQKRPYKKRN